MQKLKLVVTIPGTNNEEISRAGQAAMAVFAKAEHRAREGTFAARPSCSEMKVSPPRLDPKHPDYRVECEKVNFAGERGR